MAGRHGRRDQDRGKDMWEGRAPFQETPWPLDDILRVLMDATQHLLDDHDCDLDGHETMRRCVVLAEAYLHQREWREDTA